MGCRCWCVFECHFLKKKKKQHCGLWNASLHLCLLIMDVVNNRRRLYRCRWFLKAKKTRKTHWHEEWRMNWRESRILQNCVWNLFVYANERWMRSRILCLFWCSFCLSSSPILIGKKHDVLMWKNNFSKAIVYRDNLLRFDASIVVDELFGSFFGQEAHTEERKKERRIVYYELWPSAHVNFDCVCFHASTTSLWVLNLANSDWIRDVEAEKSFAGLNTMKWWFIFSLNSPH